MVSFHVNCVRALYCEVHVTQLRGRPHCYVHVHGAGYVHLCMCFCCVQLCLCVLPPMRGELIAMVECGAVSMQFPGLL